MRENFVFAHRQFLFCVPLQAFIIVFKFISLIRFAMRNVGMFFIDFIAYIFEAINYSNFSHVKRTKKPECKQILKKFQVAAKQSVPSIIKQIFVCWKNRIKTRWSTSTLYHQAMSMKTKKKELLFLEPLHNHILHCEKW